MNTTERFQAVQRAEFETIVGLFGKTIDGLEQLALLNLHTLHDAADEAADNLHHALSAHNAQEMIADGSSPLQRSGQRAAEYAQHVGEIASSTQAGITDAITQSMALMTKLARENAERNAAQLQQVAPPTFGASSTTNWFDSAMQFGNQALQAFSQAQRQAAQFGASTRSGGDGAATPSARAARR